MECSILSHTGSDYPPLLMPLISLSPNVVYAGCHDSAGVVRFKAALHSGFWQTIDSIGLVSDMPSNS
ncbi:MAG TPA: hypothetical protein VIC06_07290 [Solirubrobacteraceae bacterium]|jgi:hypothetical protein